ncbi:MAG: class I SAM-dependent methyltransferase [Bacillota bacterium]
MDFKFQKHDINWTREKASRVWDYYGTKKTYEDTYFSKQYGNEIINYTKSRIPLNGRILDFGCGKGFFIEKLANQNIVCEGIDFSKESLEEVVKRLGANNKFFKGVTLSEGLPTPLDKESYDVVFFIETLEHLMPEEIQPTIIELNRVTKKGGYVVLTTPNDEDLDSAKIMCPDCGCIFHMVQHMSSWSTASVEKLMGENGYKTVVCEAYTIRKKKFINTIRGVLAKLKKIKHGNIIYIGQKI